MSVFTSVGILLYIKAKILLKKPKIVLLNNEFKDIYRK